MAWCISASQRLAQVECRLFLLTMTLAIAGCAARPKPTAPPRPVVSDQPVLDLSRGGGGLPLSSEDLSSPGELVDALTRGLAHRLAFAQGAAPVALSAAAYPHLDLLRVDISNAVVHKDYKPSQSRAPGNPQPLLRVRQFEYLASPLHYHAGATSWRFTATDAAFGVLRESDGAASLVLMDAAHGSLHFSATLDDLRAMSLAGARHHARGGFRVHDATIAFTSENPRSLAAHLDVRSVWLLLPANFTLRGQLTIDENYNAHLTGLGATGHNLGGEFVAAILNRAMKKHDGKIMPVVKWPGDRVALTNVEIHLDDSLRISVDFARRPVPATPLIPTPRHAKLDQ